MKKVDFGLLSYKDTDNIGDEMQSLAARRFLPVVNHMVDREHLNTFSTPSGNPVALIMNGWHSWNPDNWPPSEQIHPLLISMHLAKVKMADGRVARDVLIERAGAYFRKWGEVGARDKATLEFLQQHRIKAYLSGCLTLTLQRPELERDPRLIVLNDLPEKLMSSIYWRVVNRDFLVTRHGGWKGDTPEERLALAERMLRNYARASCVVTTRLHCALPCLAIGTPVLLVDVGNDPERFDSLAEHVHRCNLDDLLSDRYTYNLYNPPANPTTHLPLREALISKVGGFLAEVQYSGWG